jgi:hypothetical protein
MDEALWSPRSRQAGGRSWFGERMHTPTGAMAHCDRVRSQCERAASGLRAVANLQGSDARESTCSKAVTDALDHSSNLGNQAACEASLYLTPVKAIHSVRAGP